MGNSRGFSMIVVLLAMMLLAAAGAGAVAVSTSEGGTVDARASYTQALTAADAGLQHFIAVAQPGNMPSDVDLVGSRVGDADANFVWLPGLDTDGDGQADLESRYRIRSNQQDPTPVPPNPPGQPGWVTVEGQVLRRGVVLSVANLHAVVQQRCRPNQNAQAGGGAGGTGSSMGTGCDENLQQPPALN